MVRIEFDSFVHIDSSQLGAVSLASVLLSICDWLDSFGVSIRFDSVFGFNFHFERVVRVLIPPTRRFDSAFLESEDLDDSVCVHSRDAYFVLVTIVGVGMSFLGDSCLFDVALPFLFASLCIYC